MVVRLATSRGARAVGGLLLLAVVVWQVGAGAPARAVGALDARALLVALLLAAVATVCNAWRWHLVADGLGVTLPLRAAVAACYRSQFLNTATPGGVVGDVHRGVRLGRHHADTARGLRSVLWERTAGQVVQVTLALLALVVLPSPLRPHLAWAWVLVGAATALAAATLALRLAPQARHELRHLLTSRVWPAVALASTLAVAAHLATFLVAARAAGSTASTAELVPLGLVVLVSMAVPVNLAGWGPREGVAAWAFGVAGLGSQTGLATGVAYGVLAVVACLPGAVVLLTPVVRDRLHHRFGPLRSSAGSATPVRTAGGGRHG